MPNLFGNVDEGIAMLLRAIDRDDPGRHDHRARYQVRLQFVLDRLGGLAARFGDLRGHSLRGHAAHGKARSEEHTSELQSLMRNSYAVFCLKKTKLPNEMHQYSHT